MTSPPSPSPRGRGALSNLGNRFEKIVYTPEPGEAPAAVPTEVYDDLSRSVLTDNDSPDIGYTRCLNPYRGCEHGCIYCYARTAHEYLGFSAGLDFETKLLAKRDAPALLRRELSKPSYRPVPIALSGVTDPYQPAEKRLRLTRGCLEVLAEFRHPVCIITKGTLVERDMDLLGELAQYGCVRVVVSVTTLDGGLQRRLEPRAATPRARLGIIRTLAQAGVPVEVNVAPVIPGLTDHEIPAILEAAAEAGASGASWILLRLPHGVKDLFGEWLQHHEPLKREKVLNTLRSMHGGKLYDSQFGRRLRGEGERARQIAQLFEISCRRCGLSRERQELNTAAFRQPGAQQDLFTG